MNLLDNLFSAELPEHTFQPPTRKISTRSANAESDERLLDRITDIWNAWADRHGSPKVICLTAQRGIKCRRRIQDLMRLGHDSPDSAFRFLLSKADESFFVLGNPSRPLAFDQLLTEGFMIKMVEDTYKQIQAAAGEKIMRVLICGGRSYPEKDAIEWLEANIKPDNITAVIHGCARGADTAADKWAKSHKLPVLPFPAEWEKYGKSAGAIRNGRMLYEGKPDAVIAFPGGNGTKDMMARALAANVKIVLGGI